jgi:hypothetical protein
VLTWLIGITSLSASTQKLATYGGFTYLKGEKTGFFHQEK